MPPAIPLEGPVTEDDLKRFWEKTRTSTKKVATENGDSNCIVWIAASKGGYEHQYGVFRWNNRNVAAHRFAYYAILGIDPGKSTDHLCHNTLCVNVEHLRGGTIAENNRNRRPVVAEHCKRGHPRTTQNTVQKPDGTRQCKICQQMAWRGEVREERKRGIKHSTPTPNNTPRIRNKSDFRKETVDTCKRGHDTSFPEARGKQGDCKECTRLRNAERREYKRQWKQKNKS